MIKNWRIWLPVAMVVGTLSFVVYLKRKRKTKPHGTQASNHDLDESKDNVKKVILLGLDGSGKSEFMSFLSGSNNSTKEKIEPTEGFNVVCQNSESLSINYWEIGGQEKLREYWPNFYSGTDLVLFFINSNDRTRFAEAKNVVKTLMSDPRLTKVHLMLLINKQANTEAATQAEIESALGIESVKKKWKKQNVSIISCNACNSEDVNEVQGKIREELDKVRK